MGTAETPRRRLSGDTPVPTPSELAAMLELAFITRQLSYAPAPTTRLVWTSESNGGDRRG